MHVLYAVKQFFQFLLLKVEMESETKAQGPVLLPSLHSQRIRTYVSE